MIIMALNCGSSSVKYQLFDWEKKEVVAKGMVERVIIGDSFIMHEVPGRETYHHEQDCPNHQAAIDLLIKTCMSNFISEYMVGISQYLQLFLDGLVPGGDSLGCELLAFTFFHA